MRRTSTWLSTFRQRLHEGFMLLSDKFYRTKYGAVSQQLGLAAREEPNAPSFVVVQIDSLAHEHLLLAMQRGYAPNLKRMWERGHVLSSFTCGLPSSTPASQSAIMYGNSYNIPAFRWYDKNTRRTVSYKLPQNNRLLEAEVSEGRQGILHGGSSYSNLISGGASRSLFTMSTFGQGSLLDGIKGLGFFGLFLLSPIRSLRVIVLSLAEMLYALAERVGSYIKETRRVRFEGVFPLIRILAHVFVKEMQTFAVMVDMYRGIPNIYTTYNTYDNMAHHYGPTTRPALRAVRTVDRQIRQIDRMRRHSEHEYHLWVLSDHGQTPAVPFRQLYGETFGKYVSRLAAAATLAELEEGEVAARSHVAFLADEMRSAQQKLPPTTARAVGRLRKYVETREQARSDSQSAETGTGDEDIVVTGCSGTAGIYFNGVRGHAHLTWIERAYPQLIDQLVEHPGVGLVIGRQGHRVVALGKLGRLIWDGQARVVGQNPLHDLEDSDWTLAEILRIARYPRSADLLVFGSITNGLGVAFEEQMGIHGAFGGPQAHPFLLVPREAAFAPEGVRTAHDLYPVLRNYTQQISANDVPLGHIGDATLRVDRETLNSVT